MKKVLRILLGVLILTMLWATPVFAGEYSEGSNSVYVDGENKRILADANGDMIERPAWTWYEYDGAWYYFLENNYIAWSERLTINGKNYYFDWNGTLCTGWSHVYDKELGRYKKILADENGVLYEPGWHTFTSDAYYLGDATYYVCEDYRTAYEEVCEIDGKRYYFDTSSWLKYGHFLYWDNYEYNMIVTDETGAFIELRNAWYDCSYEWEAHKHYFGDDGNCYSDGTYKIDGKSYEFDFYGKVVVKKNGWVYENNAWYYYESDGTLCKGWKTINGKTYFLDQYSGVMQEGGFREIKGSLYYFNADGTLFTEEGMVQIDGDWYLFQDNIVHRGCFHLINGIGQCYFDYPSGKLDTDGVGFDEGKAWLYDREGVVARQNGWVKMNGYWYFFNPDSSLYLGWKTIDGKKYYLDEENGRMAIGRTRIDVGLHYFDSNGVLYDKKKFSEIESLPQNSLECQRQEKIWEIINKFADPYYHLKIDTADMDDQQYVKIQAKAKELTTGCSTQYEKMKAIAEFIADEIFCDYMYEEGYSNETYTSPYSVWAKERAGYEGFANLTEAMMESIGIPCMNLYGTDHKFNAVYDSDVDRWRVVDCMWSSGNVYFYREDLNDVIWAYSGEYMDYIDLTPGQIAATSNHEIFSVKGLIDVGGDGYYTLNCSANPNEWEFKNDNNGRIYSYAEWTQSGAGWKQNSIGWWYQNADGTYPTNCWKMIDNKWYAFNARGYMREGWFNDSGTWYYLKPGVGHMLTGWQYIDGTWYYLKSSGAMATGWIQDAGTWYYLNASGAWVA